MNQIVKSSSPLVVGIGASSGGLEAFQELLRSLEGTQEFAIVFVQHLEKGAEQMLVELLTKSTSRSVVVPSGRMKLIAGSVYVCPPWTLLEARNQSVSVIVSDDNDRPATPIDHFLISLADSHGARSVGVILSGAGSDGTIGLKAISDAGGVTFAQSAETARYDSMPRSAAITGTADHVLAPHEIGRELRKYADYLAAIDAQARQSSPVEEIYLAIPAISKRLVEITNHNFQHYKQNTLARRIQRRMQLLKITSVETYVNFLNADNTEPQSLFRELLISVTAFFRDPDAFDQLARLVLPALFENRSPEETVRIWVPGCATGEEAFTIAILCREQMEKMNAPPEVQIFATDIDERALKIGRQGKYPIGIAEDVSEERLSRFFVKRGKTYQVTKDIREMVLFSVHNLISDPAFSRLDMISCRNLLIYLGLHLQQKLIPLFHYALRPSAFLILGPSENISLHGDLFEIIDAKHRISRRKATGVESTAALALETASPATNESIRTSNASADLMQVMQRIVLDEFAPKSVIVDEHGKILCASADMHKYLTVGTGSFQNNIIKLARTGLRIGLRATLQEAKSKRRRIDHDNLSVRVDGKMQRVMITVQPMPRLGQESELFMVVFHDAGLPLIHHTDTGTDMSTGLYTEARDAARALQAVNSADLIISHLELELSTALNDLEKSIQQFETANEELQVSNEELRTLNEELQSANEELETSREEIQSVANALEQANGDLENLLRSTQIATIFLDDNLIIRSFTPAATAIYGLIATDIGRPLTQLMPLGNNIPPLPDPHSVSGNEQIEDLIQTLEGKWFVRRVLPYYSKNGLKDGVVLTFTNVTELREGRQRFSSLVEASSQIVWVTDAEGIIREDSSSWRAFTGQSIESWLENRWAESIRADYRDSTLAAWADALASGELFTVEIPLLHRSGVYKWNQLRAVCQRASDGSISSWVAMSSDINDRKNSRIELERQRRQLQMITDAIPPLIAYVDNDLRFQFVNAAYANHFGRHRDSIVGQKVADILGEKRYQQIETYLRQSLNGNDVNFELELSDSESDQFHFVDVTYLAERDSDQRVLGIYIVINDISERKRTVTALADRESNLRRVIDNMLGFVGVLDTFGVLKEVNETAIVAGGIAREDVLGKPFWECYWWSHDPQAAQRCRDAVFSALQGELLRFDVEIRMAGNSRRLIDFMLAPVKDAHGNVTHLIPSGVDISERKAAEQEVQQRISQLDLALGAGRMGIWELDIHNNQISWSAQLYDMLGYSPDSLEHTRNGFLNVVHPSDRPRLEKMMTSDPSAGDALDAEFRIVHGISGKIVWTHSRGTFQSKHEADRPSILSVLVDVTERKQGELTLAFLAELQSSLTSLTSAEAITAEASQKTAEYLDLSHFMLIELDENAKEAKVIYDHCRDGANSLVGVYEMSEFATDDERRQLAAGLPMIVQDTSSPHRPIASISSFEALGVGAIINSPSSRDQRLRFMLSATKRTSHIWRDDEIRLLRELANLLRLKLDRAHAETALQQSEAKFRDLADNIAQFAWMTDASGSIFWYNQRWFDFTGTTLSEMLNWGWMTVQHPDHLDRVVSHWQKALASGEVWEDTFPLRSKDGQYRWFLSRAQPIRDETGNIVRWFGTNTDITETKQAQEALLASQEQLQLGVEVAEFALAQIDYEADTVSLTRQAAQFYGLAEDAIIVSRSEVHATFHPDDRNKTLDSIARSLDPSSDGRLAVEHRVLLPDGQVRWLDVRSRVTFDRTVDPPKPLHGILAAQDITEEKRWETELADREAHLRRVINNQLGLVGVIDRQGILVEVDDRSMSIAGLNREDVIGKHFAECRWWTYDDAVSKQIRNAMETAFAGETVRFDIGLFAKADKRLMIDFMIAPVRDANDNVTHLIPSGVDISERKLAEQQLAENKERLSMAMASARMYSYEWEPKTDRVIWDEQHRSITGLADDVTTGADFLTLVHPEDRDANRLALEKAVCGISDYDTEFRITRPDGEIRWLAARGKIVKAEGDRPLRLAGINWDITSAKEQEQRVRESEVRLRNAAEAAGFGTVHADLLRGTVTYSQELRRLVGMPGNDDEPIHINGIPEWVHPEDRAACEVHYKSLMQLPEGSTGKIDHRIFCPGGETRWVRLQSKPVYTGTGSRRKATQIIGTVLDITPQREFEQSIQEARRDAEAANQSKSEFLANMSHEIRTPMTAILGYTDLVAGLIDDEELIQHVRTIRRNGDFLLDIINDILDLSKIEAGKFEISQQHFSPQRLVEDVRSIMEIRATENAIELEVEYRGQIPVQIESDPKRLKQVLINLVGNAIKFTPTGNVKIVVSYLAQDKCMRFDIVDSGIGISDVQKQRLFQPFSQGDGNVNREFGGTGFGLVISKRLTEMLGGSISVESELGKGSTFTATIAIGNVQNVKTITSPSERDHSYDNGRSVNLRLNCHVLVVDDRRDIRFLSNRFLTDAGATVTEAENGEIAVTLVSNSLMKRTPFDLILLDMQMPKLDGYATAKALRKLGFTNPIVALTADAMQGDMKRCIESGCNDYLSKPIDRSLLLGLVSKLAAPKAASNR